MRKSNLLKIIDLPWKSTKWTIRKFRLFVKHRLGWLDVPIIVTYRGFLSGDKLFLAGAVMENKGIRKPEKYSSVWQNFLAMIKRYSSDQIPGINVEINLNGRKYTTVSDDNGYFILRRHREKPATPGNETWQDWRASADIEDETSERQISAGGELLLPGTDNTFGIISDIDDTILVSHSTQTLKKMRLMLLRNAVTRKPFPGASAFYTALHHGYSGEEKNPFFYVSSSEWNLYDLLDDFCFYNDFPKGVFMLRELEGGLFSSGQGNHQHKLDKIRRILTAFDHLPFVLIGDNGQKDPVIYEQICEEFPGRIRVIYIRSVRKRKTRKVLDIIHRLKAKGIEMLLVKDTYEAALDAANRKLISPSSGKDISRQREEDLHLLRPRP